MVAVFDCGNDATRYISADVATVRRILKINKWNGGDSVVYRAGDAVEILPEFQDLGDDEFSWIVVADEEKGRVDLVPSNHSMAIKPIYTLRVDQIRLKQPSGEI